MKPSLKLPKTVLERFLLSGRPFAIIDSELYNIEDNRYIKSKNFWEHQDKKFSLFRSDSLDKFTKTQLIDAEDDIQRYMSWIINFNYIRKLKNMSSSFTENLNYYKALKQNSIDKLLTDILHIFSHKSKIEIDEKLDLDMTVESFPSIVDLHGIKDIIHDYIPKPGIIVFNKDCYALVDGPSDGNGYVSIKGEQYTLKRTMSLEKLVDDYVSRMKGEIEIVAITHGKKFQSQIKGINERVSQFKEEIHRMKNLKDSKKLGPISYQRIGGNDYMFLAEIEPFILGKDDNYYVFNEADNAGSKKIRVGSKITIDSDSLCIQNKPKVVDMPYFHPFVHPGGEICYNSNSRWTQNGIKFTPHKYKIKEPGLARKLAYLLWEGRFAIVDGVIGSSVGPIHRLDRFNVIATNKDEAIVYARQHGIDEKRIFHN